MQICFCRTKTKVQQSAHNTDLQKQIHNDSVQTRHGLDMQPFIVNLD